MEGCEYLSEYFYWLTGLIHLEGRSGRYHILLNKLFDVPFEWSKKVPGDANREKEGYMLRQKFEHDCDILDPNWDRDLPDYCSLLEVMIALAIRCEDTIMYDPDYGNRTPIWFWMMVDNALLVDLTDEYFNQKVFNGIVDRIVHRRYGKDGFGGFFPMKNPENDMRHVELWYQLNDYIWERGL